MAGVGVIHVGLAQRMREDRSNPNSAMTAFLDNIAPLFDFRWREPSAVRAGMIPCGGLVEPVAAPRALRVCDAAGMVSPVTAGGIHTALKQCVAAGHAVTAFLEAWRADPAGWFVASYPRFRVKRLLRFLFDHLQSDFAFDLLFGTRTMRAAVSIVYFHHKGIFDRHSVQGAG